MKTKSNLLQRLGLAIAIPATALSSGCKPAYLKGIDCSNVQTKDANQVWVDIQNTYGKNITVHNFLDNAMKENGINSIIKEELKKQYPTEQKLTKQDLIDMSCYINHRKDWFHKTD